MALLCLLGHATQLHWLLQQGSWSVPTTFLRLFTGLPVSSSMSEQTFVAEFASRFRYVILTYGGCRKNTTDPCNFLWSNFCTLFDVSFLKDFLTWNQGLWKVFFRQSVSASLEQERTTVFTVQDYFSTKTHRPFAFHWKHSPILLSTLTFFPFWLLPPVSILAFLAPELRVLIIWPKVFLPLSSVFDRLALLDLVKFRGHTLLIRSAAGFTYSHLVQHLQDIFLGYVTCRL